MPSNKPTVSVRLPDDLLDYVDRLAAQHERFSRSSVIVDLIRRAADADNNERYASTVTLEQWSRLWREANEASGH